MSHILLNYAFLFFWSIYGEIIRELFFLDLKVTSQKRALKFSESWFFLPCLKADNPEENLALFKQFFFKQTSKRGYILTKTLFLHNVRDILLNYAFVLFWSIYGEIIRELFFLDLKGTSQKRALKKSESWFFLPYLKGANPEENFDFFKQLFFN